MDSDGTLLAEAKDNNKIVGILKVVNSEGTLLAVVRPPYSHHNTPHAMTYRAA